METNRIVDLLKDAEENSTQIDTMTNNIVRSYCGDLDDLMHRIKSDVIDKETVPTSVVEHYLLELSNALFFIGDRLESVGIRADVTKTIAMQAYNKAYLKLSNCSTTAKKPTVAEMTAQATESSVYESVVHNMYDSVYKMIKSRIDAGQMMHRSLSKILSRRINAQDDAY